MLQQLWIEAWIQLWLEHQLEKIWKSVLHCIRSQCGAVQLTVVSADVLQKPLNSWRPSSQCTSSTEPGPPPLRNMDLRMIREGREEESEEENKQTNKQAPSPIISRPLLPPHSLPWKPLYATTRESCYQVSLPALFPSLSPPCWIIPLWPSTAAQSRWGRKEGEEKQSGDAGLGLADGAKIAQSTGRLTWHPFYLRCARASSY